MQSTTTSFAALLKQHRAVAGWTQEELAERAGVSARAISDLERGIKHRRRAYILQRIASALDLQGQELRHFVEAARQSGAVEAESQAPAPASAMETTLQTFLIADIRGYTRFTEEQGDEAGGRLTVRFGALTHEVITTGGGQVVELRGDEALAVFGSARRALRAALALQDRCDRELEADPSLPLQIGIGLDAGEAIPVGGGYRGGALNLAARLCSLAGPGEVLATEGLLHVARKVEGLTYLDRGPVELKGLADPVRVMRVVPADAPHPITPQLPPSPSDARMPTGNFLGALPERHLVARDEELRRILSTVDAVQGDSGRFVAVFGEAGIGKTRLAQEVMLALRQRGFLVATGRCYEAKGSLAYYPFLEVLSTLYAACPISLQADIPHRYPHLTHLLPDFFPAAPTLGQQGPEEHERLFRAVRMLVTTVAGTGPVAVLVDDLHWADCASLTLLGDLVRHTRTQPVFLLGTARDRAREGSKALEALRFELEREHLAEEVSLGRMEQTGTSQLVATTLGEEEVSEEFATFLQHHSEGNAFFVQQMLQALIEGGELYRKDGRWARKSITEMTVPSTIRALIRQRLSQLSEEVQELLQAGSVLGQTLTFEELEGISGKGEEEVDEGLEAALRAGLLRELGEERYAFDHALTQQSLYAELSPRARRRLHRRAAETLERLTAGRAHLRAQRAPELARHFERAQEPDRALPYFLLAGDGAAGVFAQEEAEGHYRTARELAQSLGDRVKEAGASEKLGVVLRITGRYDQALEMLEEAISVHEAAGDLEAAGKVMAQIGYVHFPRGTPHEGITRLRTATHSLQSNISPSTLGMLYRALTDLLFANGSYTDCLLAAARASALARSAGDDRMLGASEQSRGTALLQLGRSAEALDVWEQVVPIAEAAGDLETLQQLYNNIGLLYTQNGDLQMAVRYYSRAVAAAERTGDPAQIAFNLGNLGEGFFFLGEWNQARENLERAVQLAESLGSSWHAGYPHLLLGEFLLALGEWDEATSQLEAAAAIAERTGDPQLARITQRQLAEKDLWDGRAEAAIARLAPLLDQPGQEDLKVTEFLPFLAAAYSAAGDGARARAVVCSALKRSQKQSHRIALIDALHMQGVILGRGDEWADAEVAFWEGLSLARALACPYAEARIQYDFGKMLNHKGDTDAARERFKEAQALFASLGAHVYLQWVDDALHKLGPVNSWRTYGSKP